MNALPKSSLRLLARLASDPAADRGCGGDDARALIAADLAVPAGPNAIAITDAGRALLARRAAASGGAIDPFRAQHLSVASAQIRVESGLARVSVNEKESTLAWLARRKGRDGRPLIEPHQLQAGERLRGEFTIANLMPRTTSNWHSPIARDRRSDGGGTSMTDTMIAARQRVHHALDAVGPEFSGLLLDVCCFLKRIEDVEQERGWPTRSGKIVLQLALDRLARHYGLSGQARGRARAPIRTWSEAGEAGRCGE